MLRVSAAVFACQSRACAPPPIGSGGSLPSGGAAEGGDAGGKPSQQYRRVAGDKPQRIKVKQPCHRCDGSGIYSNYHGLCYRCRGKGVDPALKTEWAVPKGWSDSEIVQWETKQKRITDAARERKQARLDSAVTAIRSEYPTVDRLMRLQEEGIQLSLYPTTVLAKIRRTGKPPQSNQLEILNKVLEGADSFVARRDAIQTSASTLRSLADGGVKLSKLTEELLDKFKKGHVLSEGQQRVLESEIAKHTDPTNAKAKAADVPTGRVTVEGKVVAMKEVESEYGTVTKMMIEGDEGWKVWVSMPKSWSRVVRRATGEVDRKPIANPRADGPARGNRVRLKATVKASPDDITFGFGSRPIDAELIFDEVADA